MSIKREYFDRWRQKLYSQQTHAEEVVTLIQQQQANNSVRQMFNFWRRHFRATLVARLVRNIQGYHSQGKPSGK